MEARLRQWLQPVLGAGADWGGAYRPVQHGPVLAHFERGEAPALFCYTDAGGQLHLALSMPQSFDKLLYVLREPGPASCSQQEGTGAAGALTAGYLCGRQPLRQLQQLIGGAIMPHTQAASATWPEQLQQDWAGQAQAFMSALTEAVHAQQGSTVLYVPPDELSDPGSAARQRELVQRLEVQLLRWTQQTRALLSRHRTRELEGHEEGPADEVQFWRQRTADLGSLRDQLDGAVLGRVLRVLEAAKSPHLPAFLSLRGSIQAEAEQAASNLVFLEALEVPCSQLAAAPPAQLLAALPGVLDVLRMVWTLAPHYGSASQMSSLLRKVSTAVVARCRSTLDVCSILHGRDLTSAVHQLEQCCVTAASWRALYHEAAGRVSTALPQRPWDFEPATIFAHVDAFVQRCRDLQELCAAQQQFGCGSQLTAVLSGTKAAEIARAIGEVQQSFGQQMKRLQGLQYDVLDVRCSQWYEDMAAFRAAARDLEQMLGNILATAMAHAACLTNKLDVIEAFAQLATRDGLRKALEARMSDWHQHFMNELAAVKQSFEGIKAALPVGLPLPQHAGQVLLLRGLLRRVEQTWDHLSSMAGYIPVVPKAADSMAAYEALHMGLQQYINTLNMQWYANVPSDLASHLSNNLLHQDKAAGGLLQVNLGPQLVAALEEAYLFERQRLAVPVAAADLLQERHRLRAVWAGMVQVCRAYNEVLGSLSSEDRRLCKDRIRFLDRRVLPGVNKLSWASPKHQTDFYHKDALRCCKGVAASVAELKAATAAVAQTCTLFREALLVKIERKRLYDLVDFEQRQAAHQDAMRGKLGEAFGQLCSSLASLYQRFAADSEEVQQEWLALLRRADAQLLEALTACVRRSLGEVARVLQGEHKSAEVSPVFVLSAILDTNGRVELKPTLQQLFDTVHGACKAAVASLEGLPRLVPEVLSTCGAAGPLPACLSGLEASPPYVDAVGSCEDAVAKQMQAITQGITSIVEKVQQLLSFYEHKYMTALWQTECTAYMRRYERANKPVSSFTADIQKYLDLKEEVLSEDAASNVRWLRLDCSTLKQQLLTLCDTWVNAFSGLLSSLASTQLSNLHGELRQHISSLMQQPQQLQQQCEPAADQEHPTGNVAGHAELAAAAEVAAELPVEQRQRMAEQLEALHGQLEAERDDLQQRIDACQEKYEALVNLQVGVPDDDLEHVDQLPLLWAEFVAALDAVPLRLRQLCT